MRPLSQQRRILGNYHRLLSYCFVLSLFISKAATPARAAEERAFYISKGEVLAYGINGPLPLSFPGKISNKAHSLLGQDENPDFTYELHDYCVPLAPAAGQPIENPYILLTRLKAHKPPSRPDFKSMRLGNDLYLLRPDGASRKVAHGVRAAKFSPRQHYVSFIKNRAGDPYEFDQTGDLVIEDLTGKQIAFISGVNDYAWAPDERIISFTRITPGQDPSQIDLDLVPPFCQLFDLWLFDLNSNQPRLLPETTAKVGSIAGFHPSGEWMLFMQSPQAYPLDQEVLWKVTINDSKLHRFFINKTSTDLYLRDMFTMSPSGRWCVSGWSSGYWIYGFEITADGELKRIEKLGAASRFCGWLKEQDALITLKPAKGKGKLSSVFNEEAQVQIIRMPQ